MLLYVKRTWVEREGPGSKPRYPELGLGEHRSHEATYGESGHLDCNLGYDERLSPVSEELVEKGKEGT